MSHSIVRLTRLVRLTLDGGWTVGDEIKIDLDLEAVEPAKVVALA